MKPFEPADIVFIEMLKARHESLKAQLAAAKRAPQDAQHAAEIAAELREMVDKATAEFFELPTDSRRSRKSAHALGGTGSRDSGLGARSSSPGHPRPARESSVPNGLLNADSRHSGSP